MSPEQSFMENVLLKIALQIHPRLVQEQLLVKMLAETIVINAVRMSVQKVQKLIQEV